MKKTSQILKQLDGLDAQRIIQIQEIEEFIKSRYQEGFQKLNDVLLTNYKKELNDLNANIERQGQDLILKTKAYIISITLIVTISILIILLLMIWAFMLKLEIRQTEGRIIAQKVEVFTDGKTLYIPIQETRTYIDESKKKYIVLPAQE